MKLSEFRKIIDRLDDEARENEIEEEDIVLDIDPDGDSELKIGIADIFKSKLSKNTVKIEPGEAVKKVTPARSIRKDRDIIIDQTSYYCPECGKKIGKNDKFCRFCGQRVLTVRELMKEEDMDRKARRRARKEAAKESRRKGFLFGRKREK